MTPLPYHRNPLSLALLMMTRNWTFAQIAERTGLAEAEIGRVWLMVNRRYLTSGAEHILVTV